MENDSEKNVPNKLFNKKKKRNSLIKKIKSPDVSHINKDSFFIYDQYNAILHYNSLQNKNLIKINKEDIDLLKNIVNDIKIEKIINSNELFIEIPFKFFKKINEYNPEKKENNELIDFIKNEINNNTNRSNISCRKLSKLYEQKTGKKIGKSTIHKILRKKMDYRFLKTTYKTKKIISDDIKLHSFFFIKAFVKFIKLDFNFIFIDETKIELINNHMRCWRKPDEQILFGNNSKEKKNLILAISKSEVINYEITEQNTTSNLFLKFLEDLKIKLDKKDIKKYVLICDNCTSHKTDNIIEFLNNNKLCTIFTPPYQSTFTPIELAFRALKNITYKKIYLNLEDVVNDIKNFLENTSIKDTLLYNYKETIQQYISYSELNNQENLNNYIIKDI